MSRAVKLLRAVFPLKFPQALLGTAFGASVIVAVYYSVLFSGKRAWLLVAAWAVYHVLMSIAFPRREDRRIAQMECYGWISLGVILAAIPYDRFVGMMGGPEVSSLRIALLGLGLLAADTVFMYIVHI